MLLLNFAVFLFYSCMSRSCVTARYDCRMQFAIGLYVWRAAVCCRFCNCTYPRFSTV